MSRAFIRPALYTLVAAGVLCSGACSTGTAKTNEREIAAIVVAVAPVAAVEQPIARFIRVTGTLTAEEQADVAAETAGRVIATPVERGTAVEQGAELVKLSPIETEASLKEAEANAAQIEARLVVGPSGAYDVNKVPEVANARANYDLAVAEFGRIEKLLSERVVSQSEYDQRNTQVEASRQQYESAKNAAEQQYQALQASRARVTLARKALADTDVRAPFAGLVAQRMVSTGDYVTRGMKVAEVVRITPLRIELTVPEQFVASVGVGQPVSFSVDAFSGRMFEGRVRYVSPALRAEQRALTVEAVVPNANAQLKPGMFATALIEQNKKEPGILVPAAAVRIVSGTARVFVVNGDRVEERVVATGQRVDPLIEVVTGLKPGERVATENVNQLIDGMKVR
ncbi:MAG TPA: efflux RND transporter periplasmic adaptor subunit [Vicinamibacterales bacterium]|nr:efflux RND transporter periplasmic adaptor subunit [Vicinamibacterales bacterium]